MATDNTSRDWLHVEDHCRGILLVLRQGKSGEQYNIGGGDERTNRAVVEQVCTILEELLPASKNATLKKRGITTYSDLMTFVTDRPAMIDAMPSMQQKSEPISVGDHAIHSSTAWHRRSVGMWTIGGGAKLLRRTGITESVWD